MSNNSDWILATDLAYTRPSKTRLYGKFICGDITWACRFLHKLGDSRCGYPQKNECVMVTKAVCGDERLADITAYVTMLFDGSGRDLIKELINV